MNSCHGAVYRQYLKTEPARSPGQGLLSGQYSDYLVFRSWIEYQTYLVRPIWSIGIKDFFWGFLFGLFYFLIVSTIIYGVLFARFCRVDHVSSKAAFYLRRHKCYPSIFAILSVGFLLIVKCMLLLLKSSL